MPALSTLFTALALLAEPAVLTNPTASATVARVPVPAALAVEDPLLSPVPRAEREIATWAEAMELLRRSSTDERSAVAAVERAEGRWRQSLAALLPNARFTANLAFDILNPDLPPLGVAGVGGGAPTSDRRPTAPLGAAAIGLTQSVIDVSAWRGLDAADEARNSAHAGVEDVHRRLTQGLARALVAIVTAERVSELNRLGLQQALERAALTERTRELGAKTMVDVVRVEQDVEVARGTLIAGNEQLLRTREALGQLLGFGHGVSVTPRLELAGIAAETQCSGLRWEDRPDLVAARANLESARLARTQAEAGYLPTVSVASNLVAYTSDPGPASFATWSIAAIIAVPIWEGGARGGIIRERSGAEEQAAQALEATRRQVEVEVARARRGVSVAEALARTAQSARDKAAQLDQLTRRAFEVGSGSSLELVQSAALLRQADVTLATRELELVQARLDAFLTEASCNW